MTFWTDINLCQSLFRRFTAFRSLECTKCRPSNVRGNCRSAGSGGLTEEWWHVAMECCCHVENICESMADGKTACQKRFNVLLKGPVIPLGAKIAYMGFSLTAGGGWVSDLFVADWDDNQQALIVTPTAVMFTDLMRCSGLRPPHLAIFLFGFNWSFGVPC